MTPPKRQLGLAIAAAIVIANMIGSGVFTTAGFQAASLHDPLTMMLTWVVGGVLALCGAACYAELGAMMPHAGGEYVYLRDAYHPAVGFMSGWVSLTAGFSAPIAAAALGFVAYVAKVVPGLESDIAQKVVACTLIAGVTALHAFDTKLGGRVQTGFTIAKVALITVFIIAGLAFGNGDWSHLAHRGEGLGIVTTSAGAGQVATALMYVMFAYSGWNAAAYIAGEIENPQKTLPRALLLGTGVVMVLYILLNLTFLYGVAPETMSGVKEVGDLAARSLFGGEAGRLISTLIALALVSSVSSMMMAGPRVYASMAADHALPRPLARYSKRGVPAVAVVTQCVLAIAFVIAGDLRGLIDFAIFTLSIFAALTVGAVFVFRWRAARALAVEEDAGGRVPKVPNAKVVKAPDQVRPYRTFGYPVTPILYISLSALIVYLKVIDSPKESLEVLGLLVLGAVIYALTSAGRVRQPIEADE